MIQPMDPSLIVAFATLVGGVAAYVTSFALLTTIRRRARSEYEHDDTDDDTSADTRRRGSPLPDAARLAELTPL